jgi:hypothetical protein
MPESVVHQVNGGTSDEGSELFQIPDNPSAQSHQQGQHDVIGHFSRRLAIAHPGRREGEGLREAELDNPRLDPGITRNGTTSQLNELQLSVGSCLKD